MTSPVRRPEARVHDAGAERTIQSVPLSHVSIEVGHLYFEDFGAGADGLRRHFDRIVPWVEAARALYARAVGDRTLRISSCFLVDDYFGPSPPPADVIPNLVKAARDSGVEIDYLARESACVHADGVPVARLVQERIVEDPAPGTTGTRPPTTETGWLPNGTRSPVVSPGAAMDAVASWRPPTENATTRHSVFVDVELWDERGGERVWSCAFLAGVWQLLRLGLLRHRGARVAEPRPWDEPLPDAWVDLPAVTTLNPAAAPFCAYRSMSVLAGRFLPTEQAVRTILGQVAVDPAVTDQILARGRGEGISLPAEAIDRIDYVFVG